MNAKTLPGTYEEAVAFIQDIPLFSQTNDLGSTRRLLALLGHPEAHFHVIHVAGTNGKGSVCAFLDAIFRKAGKKTGLFTSPHLVRVNERIRVQGEEIPDEAFLQSFRRVRRCVWELTDTGGREPTYFEYLFAMGLCWFEQEGIDLMVCETGMGGRLDATNAISKADAAVITSIGLDHTKYLGGTIEQIAGEKAGIIRSGVPVIYCAFDPESAGVIAERALRMGAEPIPLYQENIAVTARDDASVLARLTQPGKAPLELMVPFAAKYQAENAALAALCALRLGAGLKEVQSGVAHTEWIGRMQQIGNDVIIDGAHNPDGIRRIAEEIRRMAQSRRVWLVTAIVADKDHAKMARELCRDISYDGIVVTKAGGGRQLPAEVLAQEFIDAGQRRVLTQPDPESAYHMALKEKGDGVLFCAGSLYLAGEILSIIEDSRVMGPDSRGDHNAEL